MGGGPTWERFLPGGGLVRKGVKGQQGQNLGVVGQEPARQVDDPLVLLVGLGARRGGVLGPLPLGRHWAPAGPATSLSPVVGRNWGRVAPKNPQERACSCSLPPSRGPWPVGHSIRLLSWVCLTAGWSVAALGPHPIALA